MAVHGMCCPGCGTAFDQGDRFCRFCGTPSGSGVRESSFATVLYSDLNRYTSLSSMLDPEELKVLMDGIFREVSGIITSLGGVVEKFVGDAVVALFGISHTREDDPIRAIHSAFLIHERVSSKVSGKHRLSMHTGVHSGKVLVDRLHQGHHSPGAMGMPIIMAARLSDAAAPGEILVDRTVVHEATRFFVVEALGPRILKGIDGQVPVYRVASPRTVPLSIHRPGAASSPLKGRTEELASLRAAYAALSPGKGGLCLITGESGTGKSRLVLEFLKTLPADACRLTVQCLDHMKDIPYHPVISLIRQVIALAGKERPGPDGMDGDAGGREAGSCLLEELMSNPRHAFHLRSLLEIGHGQGDLLPDVWRAEISEAVASLLEAFSRGRVPVVSFDDFHWSDATTRDLISELALSEEGRPGCLFVLTSREHLLPEAKGVRIAMHELSRDHTKALFEDLLEIGRLPDEAVDFLSSMTGGNPLFIEEYASFLKDRGIPPLQGPARGIPSTMEGIIMARLERLGPSAKRVLQAASVIGMIFDREILGELLPEGEDVGGVLAALEGAGFITCGPAGECSFRHALTREAAAASLLKNRRCELHRRIGFLLEKAVPGREKHCGTIAYHLYRAREFGRAYPYCMLAARTFQAEGSWMEAAAHYSWARECLVEGGSMPGREDLLVAVCEGIWSCSRIFSPDQAITALEELAAIHRAAGRTNQEVFSLIRLINLYAQKALFKKAVDTFEDVLPRTRGNAFLSSAARTAMAYTCTYLGKPIAALAYLEQARAGLDSPDRFLLQANELTTLAACVWKGDVQGGLAWYSRLRQGSSPYLDLELMSDVWLGYLLFLKGELVKGTEVLEQVRAREKKLGCLAGGFSYLRIQSSIYLYSRYAGKLDRAREELSVLRAREPVDASSSPLQRLYASWIALEAGGSREVVSLLEGVPDCLENGVANRLPYALNTLAEAWLKLGEPSRAEEAARRSVEWNTRNGNTDQLIWALRIRGLAFLHQGRRDLCREPLLSSSSLARASGMPPHVAWGLSAWADYHHALGNGQKARACLEKARTLWLAMGSPFQAERMREKLAVLASG